MCSGIWKKSNRVFFYLFLMMRNSGGNRQRVEGKLLGDDDKRSLEVGTEGGKQCVKDSSQYRQHTLFYIYIFVIYIYIYIYMYIHLLFCIIYLYIHRCINRVGKIKWGIKGEKLHHVITWSHLRFKWQFLIFHRDLSVGLKGDWMIESEVCSSIHSNF